MKKEKSKKDPERKPKYSLFQNLIYYFGILRKFKSKVIFMVFIGIPFAILATVISMYTPKIILDRLQLSDSFGKIALVIICIFVSKLLIDLINNKIDSQKKTYDLDVFSYFSVMCEKKNLSLDYEYLEDPNTQTIASKAKNAIVSNHTMMVKLPSTLSSFFFNAVCFLIFGIVLSTLNPLIIAVLILTSFIGYFPMKWLRNYTHKTKDQRASDMRKIYYFMAMSQDFSGAKDIRLYSMEKCLTDMTKSTLRQYEGSLIDLENKSFLADIADFGAALLRDGFAYAYLIWCAVQGDITAGDFVLYFSAISSFSAWFSGVLSGWSDLQNTSLEICDYREFMEMTDRFNHGAGVPLPPKDKPVEIKLEDVSFIYPNAQAPALENIN